MHFVDRQARYPNRWTLKKSDGSSEVVTLIRNDEPSVEGTPMNAETLNTLSDVAGADVAREKAESAAQQASGCVTDAQKIVNNARDELDKKVSTAQGYVSDASDYASQAAASATAAKNCTGGYYADYSLTIPVSAWGYNTMASSTFAYEAKISVADCTSDMIPLGSIELGSYETARAAGMACMCYADNNCVRFFAQEKPTAEIKMQVSILAHMANISAYLDIDRATDAEINELIETYFGKEG